MGEEGKLGIVLTGGGARAAYQVGFLRCLARKMPALTVPVITGVSAGAINAVFLAAHRGGLPAAAEKLTRLWSGLSVDKVFHIHSWFLARTALHWGLGLLSGGHGDPQLRGLLDTTPLRKLLEAELEDGRGRIPGIAENLAAGRLESLAVSTLKYATGQTVTWVQGREIESWVRPHRLGVRGEITAEHVMASSALPVVFPAQKLGDGWYGDGGVRSLTPLAPAIHLGANRILAISTRYGRTLAEASDPAVAGYPPPAQILGTMLNAVFLDSLDHDALHLERINMLLAGERRGHLRPLELLVLRPSQDIGRLAAAYEERLPGAFRFVTRGLGTRRTASPDFLSLLMFQPEYLERLMEIGEADAEARFDEIERLLNGNGPGGGHDHG
ncbi:MAG: patatin-like phospholipase family protein [Acidobacteriota bacterium]|nr:patatin-like phospholipase family protein [Acidobacteriota bacterium]